MSARGRPFAKGQSGNPGGKPKELKELQLEARRLTPKALATLAEVCKSGRPDAARVAAAIAILDRAFGKPALALEHSGPDGQPIETRAISDDMRARALSAFMAKMRAKGHQV
jgi:uncharacterized protein DUF5681